MHLQNACMNAEKRIMHALHYIYTYNISASVSVDIVDAFYTIYIYMYFVNVHFKHLVNTKNLYTNRHTKTKAIFEFYT